jgi:hypothetical protein
MEEEAERHLVLCGRGGGGTRWRAACWHWPKEAVVWRQEGESLGGPSWARVGHELGQLWEISKRIETGYQGHQAELKK